MSVSICYQCATLLHCLRPVSWDRRWMDDRWSTNGMIRCDLFDGAAFCYFKLLLSVLYCSLYIFLMNSDFDFETYLFNVDVAFCSVSCVSVLGFHVLFRPILGRELQISQSYKCCGVWHYIVLHTHSSICRPLQMDFSTSSIFQWDMYKGDEFTINVECLKPVQGPISGWLSCVFGKRQKKNRKNCKSVSDFTAASGSASVYRRCPDAAMTAGHLCFGIKQKPVHTFSLVKEEKIVLMLWNNASSCVSTRDTLRVLCRQLDRRKKRIGSVRYVWEVWNTFCGGPLVMWTETSR